MPLCDNNYAFDSGPLLLEPLAVDTNNDIH